ncbi:MAG: VWA domain-containing protein [Caldilineaceae bacterium]
MSFGQPLFLWAFLLIPLSIFFLQWAQRRRQAALRRLGNAGLITQLSATVNWRGRRWQQALWLVALSFLLLALARPQWGSQVQVVEQEGVQVMVALDISKSMLAADLKPDRLSRAKFEISDLMNRLKGDEIGLALFAGASFIQFPLTSDYDTARAFLDGANPGMISRPGTAIGDAIRTASQGFDPHRSNQKVMIIMTDGEDHEADVMPAAQNAAEQGIIIYTIGFGSPQGEPIPEFDDQDKLTGYKKDANGAPVLSKLDEVTLQQIALATHGRYFRAGASGAELDALAGELDRLQKAQLESRFTVQKIERYQIFLSVAILALLLAELIPERVRQRMPKARRWWQVVARPVNLLLVLLGITLAGCGESAGRMVAQGNEAFAKADYPVAQNAYQSAQSLAPQTAAPIYNLANTFYREGVYTTTQQLLPQAVNLADDTLAQAGYYNLGNSHYQSQQWEQAVEAYKEALRRNPTDQDAKHNLELALRHLQQQQQQDQQQQQQQQNQQQDQQKQDKQQQNQQAQQDQPQQQQQKSDQSQQPQNQDQQQAKQDQSQQDQANQQQAGQDQANQDQKEQAQQQAAGDQQDQPQPSQTPVAGVPNQATTALSEEQARQLLNSIGQHTQTLQERLQGVYVVPGPTPDKDW